LPLFFVAVSHKSSSQQFFFLAIQSFERDSDYYARITKDLPIEVKLVPGKGRGLFAKADILQGKRIWSETPFLIALSDIRVRLPHQTAVSRD
jgi:hypothetical protein